MDCADSMDLTAWLCMTYELDSIEFTMSVVFRAGFFE